MTQETVNEGRWPASQCSVCDTLVARRPDGRELGRIMAHDGDFFPESVFPYIEAVCRLVIQPDAAVGPVRIDMDVSQCCNAKCLFCFAKKYQKGSYAGRHGDFGLIERTIAELAELGTRTIRYCGGGEPLAHPAAKDILRLPRRYGLKSALISNLDLLDDETAAVIADGIDHLRWSVNAATEETRRRIHRPDARSNSLDRTCRLVGEIVQGRRRTGAGPVIWATFLLHPDNYREIVECARLLRDVGVDTVCYRPIFFDLRQEWDAQQVKEAEVELDKVRRLHDPGTFNVVVTRHSPGNEFDRDPSHFFDRCISCRLRGILETAAEGLILQRCGLFRGVEAAESIVVDERNSIGTVWRENVYRLARAPVQLGCHKCIDISINVSLAFICRVLREHPHAEFSAVASSECCS
jgi:MoaA/NifB/PqqE/SkfB family radical SAM enzyme